MKSQTDLKEDIKELHAGRPGRFQYPHWNLLDKFSWELQGCYENLTIHQEPNIGVMVVFWIDFAKRKESEIRMGSRVVHRITTSSWDLEEGKPSWKVHNPLDPGNLNSCSKEISLCKTSVPVGTFVMSEWRVGKGYDLFSTVEPGCLWVFRDILVINGVIRWTECREHKCKVNATEHK